MARTSASMKRRAFLSLSAAAATSLTFASSRSSWNASAAPGGGPSTSKRGTGRKGLLVFFSRAGENYFNGGRKVLKVGNTEIVAGMIRDAVGCDVFRIEPVDPYSDRYEPTVQRNVREQNENARPGIVGLPASIAAYDTILIGSPIWNVRAPRIVLTFAEHFDFTGKKVHPFTTYAMSGLGHVVEEYTAACRGATINEALAIRGEEAERSRPKVEAWLRRIGLIA
jgi:flavodoxin